MDAAIITQHSRVTALLSIQQHDINVFQKVLMKWMKIMK